MVEQYHQSLQDLQRQMALRVASAYTSVSLEAVLVIVRIPDTTIGPDADESSGKVAKNTAWGGMISEWQAWWDVSSKGWWTHRAIRMVKP